MKNTAKRGFLLASFFSSIDEQEIINEIEHIVNLQNLSNNYIFLFSQVDEPSKKIVTYNAFVESGKPLNSRLVTMRVHRKKQTNTLYTINALNKAVALDNEGQTGKHLKLDWEKYKECILLTSKNELVCHQIKVDKIFKVEEPPEDE